MKSQNFVFSEKNFVFLHDFRNFSNFKISFWKMDREYNDRESTDILREFERVDFLMIIPKYSILFIVREYMYIVNTCWLNWECMRGAPLKYLQIIQTSMWQSSVLAEEICPRKLLFKYFCDPFESKTFHSKRRESFVREITRVWP